MAADKIIMGVPWALAVALGITTTVFGCKWVKSKNVLKDAQNSPKLTATEKPNLSNDNENSEIYKKIGRQILTIEKSVKESGSYNLSAKLDGSVSNIFSRIGAGGVGAVEIPGVYYSLVSSKEGSSYYVVTTRQNSENIGPVYEVTVFGAMNCLNYDSTQFKEGITKELLEQRVNKAKEGFLNNIDKNVRLKNLTDAYYLTHEFFRNDIDFVLNSEKPGVQEWIERLGRAYVLAVTELANDGQEYCMFEGVKSELDTAMKGGLMETTDENSAKAREFTPPTLKAINNLRELVKKAKAEVAE